MRTSHRLTGVPRRSRLLALACALACAAALCGCDRRPAAPRPASLLPSRNARGGRIDPAALQGNVWLLSFIDSREVPGGTTGARPSRSQVNFLESMERQYAGLGARFIVADASGLGAGRRASAEEISKAALDWGLGDIPLIPGGERAASALGVRELPSTFLVGRDGAILEAWRGLATAAQLASALSGALEGKAGASTPAQARFRGLPPARDLGSGIWLVDGGRDWAVGSPTAAKWLAPGQGGILHVAATRIGFPAPRVEAEVRLEALSQGDAAEIGLASGPSAGRWSIGGSEITLGAPGAWRIEARLSVGPAGAAGEARAVSGAALVAASSSGK